jgi:hypothetical protein
MVAVFMTAQVCSVSKYLFQVSQWFPGHWKDGCSVMTPQGSFSYKIFVTGITAVLTELMVAVFMTAQVSLRLKIFVTSITMVHQSLNCHNYVPGQTHSFLITHYAVLYIYRVGTGQHKGVNMKFRLCMLEDQCGFVTK